jgi:hypothetical protein
MKLSDRVIVNVAVSDYYSWYRAGQQRLLNSLKQNNNNSNYEFSLSHDSLYGNPYSDKIMSIYYAYKRGYKYILYLDCSIRAIKNTEPIWNYIQEKGYYLYKSQEEENCAVTSNDHCLSCYGVTRDSAENILECSSSVFGISLETDFGQQFIEDIAKSVSNGAVNGIKWPTEEQRLIESADPRFKHHRQDQSVISLVAGKLNLPMEQEGHFVSRWENAKITMNENIIFTLKGGI